MCLTSIPVLSSLKLLFTYKHAVLLFRCACSDFFFFFQEEVINPLLTIPGASSTEINGQKDKRALALPLHLSKKRGEGGRDHFEAGRIRRTISLHLSQKAKLCINSICLVSALPTDHKTHQSGLSFRVLAF